MKAVYVIRLLLSVFFYSLYFLIEVVIAFTFKNNIIKYKKRTSKNFFTLTGVNVAKNGVFDDSCDMLVLNHQALADIPIIEVALMEYKVSWIAKKELFSLPIFGKIMTMSHNISLDRDSKASLIKLIKDSKNILSRGFKIAMFPEGTRSKDRKILKFKMGAKFLADKIDLKIQPIVVINSSNTFGARDVAFGSEVKVVFLESFKSKERDNWLVDLKDEMQKVYDKEVFENEHYV